MKIIIISKDGDALDLAIRLKREGHQVKVAIQDKDFLKVGSGFGLTKGRSWQKDLSWSGKTASSYLIKLDGARNRTF